MKEYKQYRWLKLDINYSRKELYDIFLANEQHARIYYSQKRGDPQPIRLLNPSKDQNPYLLKLQSKFNFIRDGYFLTSRGYEPHIDDRRQCIISFEVKNDHNVPLKFYEPDEEVYHDKVVMWNTTVLHGSESSPSERIFYQIELLDNNSFEYYVKQFNNKKLYTSNNMNSELS